MGYGDKIRIARESKGWTQEELAQKVGLSGRDAVCKIERGLRQIPRSKIALFSKILSIQTSELMGWDENSAPIIITNDKSADFQKVVDLLRQLNDEELIDVENYILFLISKKSVVEK